MTAARFILAADVAHRLGLADGRAFLRQRRALERDHHFPAPMPGCARPMRWRADAVAAWIEGHGLPGATAATAMHPAPVASTRVMQEART